MLNLSPSKINTYLLCPFKYKCETDTNTRNKYKKDTAPLIFGNLIHACLNDFYKRTKKENRNLQRLRDLFKEKFVANMGKHKKIFKTKENITEYVEKAKKMFANFLKSELFNNEPLLTEEYPKCLINNWLELGGKFDRVDIIDNKIRIVDYKTGRVKEDEADTFQLDLYELLLRKLMPDNPVGEKILFYLSENKILRYPAEISYSKIENKLLRIAETINKDGEFMPKPNRMCRFCDYKELCPAKDAC